MEGTWFYGLKKWWKSGFLGKKMEGTGFYGLKNGGNGILGRNHGRKRILGINPILFYSTGRIWGLGSGGKKGFGGNLKFRVPGVAASLAPPSGWIPKFSFSFSQIFLIPAFSSRPFPPWGWDLPSPPEIRGWAGLKSRKWEGFGGSGVGESQGNIRDWIPEWRGSRNPKKSSKKEQKSQRKWNNPKETRTEPDLVALPGDFPGWSRNWRSWNIWMNFLGKVEGVFRKFGIFVEDVKGFCWNF